MDEAKILEMARQAGFSTLDEFGLGTRDQVCVDTCECTSQLLAFARLVAAAERERACRIVGDDMMAVTYQSVGQYRSGLVYHIKGVDRPSQP